MTIRKPKKWGSVKPPVGFGVDWSDPINKSLIGCWLFNEGAGNTLYDIAQKNNGAGTVLTWSPGAFGPSGKFDGVSSFVTISALPTMANPWTLSGWVKWAAIVNLGGAFGFGSGTNGVWAGTTATNFKILSNGETPGNGATTPTTGKWYHVALVWDGTKLNAYLNGVFEYNVTPTGSNWKSSTVTEFGKYDPSATFFNGSLDAIRTHARALSAWEIMRLYREPFAGVLSPRRRLWSSVSAGGSNVTGVGSSTGTAVVSGIGAALVAGIATSVGLGVAAAVGAATAVAVGIIAGIAVASGIGAELAAAIATAAGAATAPGKSAGPGIGSAAGVGAANGISLSIVVSGVGTATGTALVIGIPVPVWNLTARAAAAWAQQNAAAASWSLVASLSATWTPNAVPSPTWINSPAGASWAKQFP